MAAATCRLYHLGETDTGLLRNKPKAAVFPGKYVDGPPKEEEDAFVFCAISLRLRCFRGNMLTGRQKKKKMPLSSAQ
jgi:hypothetical protein